MMEYILPPPAPHRFRLLNVLSRLEFTSLFEVGCSWGANLIEISKRWPNLRIGGCDIESKNLEHCPRFVPTAAVVVGNESSILGHPDLVLIDGVCVIYPDPENILRTAWAAAEKYLVLSEWNCKGRGSFIGDRVRPCRYWVHDFEALLGPAEHIEHYAPEDWPGERNENWRTYGDIMVWSK